MNSKWFRVYCFILAFIVMVPLIGTLMKLSVKCSWLNETELSGVSAIPTKPKISLSTFLSGEFQTKAQDYLTYNLFSRRTQTRIYNQLLCSLFHSTDNRDMLVGRENYIYEKAYASAYLFELTKKQDAELKKNIQDMERLTQLLKKHGITLVVRMSPSKAEIYPEYLPSSYDRFSKMKQSGKYSNNWYETFCKEIRKTGIPYYDRFDMLLKMKKQGEIVFTKGGTHWSLAPMKEYINGLNAYMEPILGRKLGRMVENSKSVVVGTMGTPDDDDIWKICWNSFSAPPDYPSPNINYTTISGDKPFHVFTIGQSFTNIILDAIYNKSKQPVWAETDFSWYNSRVMHYPSELAWGTQVSDQTNDFAKYLNTDVIMIEFLQNGDGTTQFQFVKNMLKYLTENG